jgi:hypothetical protein
MESPEDTGREESAEVTFAAPIAKRGVVFSTDDISGPVFAFGETEDICGIDDA